MTSVQSELQNEPSTVLHFDWSTWITLQIFPKQYVRHLYITSLDLVTTFIPTCKHTLAFPYTDLVSITTFEHTQLSQDSFEWRCLHLHTFAHAFPTSVNIEPNLHMLTYICMSHNTLVHDSFQKVVTQCTGCKPHSHSSTYCVQNGNSGSEMASYLSPSASLLSVGGCIFFWNRCC